MDDHRRAVRVGLIALAVTSALSCAEERNPINRVQANALAKDFFVGADLSNPADDPEFYASSTVIDVPFGVTASLMTGATGELRRIKWEISEKVLNARLTYENVQDVDGKGARTTNDGQVIASFDIESHFDVKREYNPQTGEELNIIGENTSDRPWYQRSYMRVDWSSNKVVSAYTFDPLASFKAEGQTLESLTYRVDNPSDPDAPVFDAKGGYFDVTNKIYVKPGVINGQPACMYYAAIVVGGSYPYGACDPTEVKLRLSFMRVAQQGEAGYRDYQVQEWDGARFNAHGAFTRDRLGYDRHYGIIDSKWHHLIQRYNIWDKSHTEVTCARDTSDSHVDASPADGTEDSCAAAGAGSRCDDFVGFCTIPYAQRKIRTNAWHYNLNGDDEVAFESTNHATEEWDTALRLAVQAARRVECERTNGASVAGTRWAATVQAHSGDPKPCDAAFPMVQTDDAEVESVRAVNQCWKDQGRGAAACAPSNPNSVAALDTMIALCHSPVREQDDPMCGPVGLVTRPGDLRYHQVNVVPTPQSASPWGYGPTAADPLTGEVIQASINVWNSVTDQTAQLMVDQIRWINGEIAADKVTSGDYVQDWARAASGHSPGSSPLMTRAAIDQRILGTGATTAAQLARVDEIRKSIDLSQLKQTLIARSTPGFAQPGVAAPASGGGTARAEAAARVALAKGTPTEAALVTPPWLAMAGVDKKTPIDSSVLERASPLRNLDGENIALLEQKVNATLAAQGQCMMMAPEPNGITPLAKIMAKKFPYDANASATAQASRVDKMWNYLRGKLNYAVIGHEMGHTVGLRHNFTSSFDKFNYRPQYWQLRTHNGEVSTPCDGPVADGSKCVGPRYYDPLDQDESDQLIWMWQQTSIMDYAGDTTQDTIGIGVYDYSAARAFYADVVDVRNDGVTVPASNKQASQMTTKELAGREMFDLVDTAVQPLAQAFVTDPKTNKVLHYSEWNNLFHMLDPARCRDVDTSAPKGWDAAKNGEYDPVFDGHIVLGKVCDRIPVEYVDWRDMVADTSFAMLVNYDPRWIVTRRAVDKQGRPRMPYAFGTDDAVEAGIPSTYQHDNGADIYEEMQFHDTLYEDRHIFDNFRRGKVSFSIYGAYQRAVSRYHGKIASLAEQYSFIHDYILRDSAAGSIGRGTPYSYAELVAEIEGDGGGLRDFALASSVAFDHFVRVLTRPQPGPHAFVVGDNEVIRPFDGAEIGTVSAHQLDIPQGSMGFADPKSTLTDVTYGGRPLQNSVVSSDGYYNVNQAGSYYEKTHAMFNIVAQGMGSGNWTRAEGVDSRWLSSNFSNLYPDGVRRLLGVLLTEDQALYGARVATRSTGAPDVTWNQAHTVAYPAKPMGWISFAEENGPRICWPTGGLQVCADDAGKVDGVATTAPTSSIAVDPELGFEIQKFILFYSYVFLPGSQKNDWVDMLRIFKIGNDVNPVFDAKEMVQWKDPQTGYVYLAKRFGDEQLFGKSYDKGIGAKMVQWANTLSSKAYVPADATAPFDPATGRFVYKVDDRGLPVVAADPIIAPSSTPLACEDNHYCVQLRNYRALLDYSRETATRVGFPDPALLGVYAGQPQP